MSRTKDGQFEKGVSGNPGGRPRTAELRLKLTPHIDAIVTRLVNLSKSKQPAISLRASCEILNRFYGMPVQAMELTGENGGPMEVKELTTQDRARALAAFIEATKAGKRNAGK